jgi:hypothetical protein
MTVVPTLLWSTSIRPRAATVSSTMRATSAARVTSPLKVEHWPPLAAMMARVSSAAAPSRSTAMTIAPSSA